MSFKLKSAYLILVKEKTIYHCLRIRSVSGARSAPVPWPQPLPLQEGSAAPDPGVQGVPLLSPAPGPEARAGAEPGRTRPTGGYQHSQPIHQQEDRQLYYSKVYSSYR